MANLVSQISQNFSLVSDVNNVFSRKKKIVEDLREQKKKMEDLLVEQKKNEKIIPSSCPIFRVSIIMMFLYYDIVLIFVLWYVIGCICGTKLIRSFKSLRLNCY